MALIERLGKDGGWQRFVGERGDKTDCRQRLPLARSSSRSSRFAVADAKLERSAQPLGAERHIRSAPVSFSRDAPLAGSKLAQQGRNIGSPRPD
jgi:hypothetical protein